MEKLRFHGLGPSPVLLFLKNREQLYLLFESIGQRNTEIKSLETVDILMLHSISYDYSMIHMIYILQVEYLDNLISVLEHLKDVEAYA